LGNDFEADSLKSRSKRNIEIEAEKTLSRIVGTLSY
jgi:hypothetical protein